MKPQDLEWIEGDLPDVATVPKNSWYLVWIVGVESKELWTILTVHPWENELNPLRWCDSSSFPLGGTLLAEAEVAYWAKIT